MGNKDSAGSARDISTPRRSYHENGSIASEVTEIDGIPHGITRHWHPNGVLAMEIPLDHGVIDGSVKQWNDKGELLGSCEIRNGTGVHRTWWEDGSIMGEISMMAGKLSGRQRAFGADDEIAGETYWLDNKKLSKKRYREACQQDPSLPRYEDDRSAQPAKRQPARVSRPTAKSEPVTDELPAKLLQGPRVREALQWLEESNEPSRTLGEATEQGEAIRLIRRLYKLGAVAINAVEIDGEADEDQNSGRLVLELPQDPSKRKKLLRVIGVLAQKSGFEPDPDVGQRYALLMLD